MKESEALVEWYRQRKIEVRTEAHARWYLVHNEVRIFRPGFQPGLRDDRWTTKTLWDLVRTEHGGGVDFTGIRLCQISLKFTNSYNSWKTKTSTLHSVLVVSVHNKQRVSHHTQQGNLLCFRFPWKARKNAASSPFSWRGGTTFKQRYSFKLMFIFTAVQRYWFHWHCGHKCAYHNSPLTTDQYSISRMLNDRGTTKC